MEEMTVVSFCVSRTAVAWEDGWKYEIWENAVMCGEEVIRHIKVELPFWKEKDTMWQQEEQKKYLQVLPVPV